MKTAVLECLKSKPGGWVSGGKIARTLGISRTAVWKQVRALRDEGYLIESRRRHGYCLRAAPDLLTAADVQAGLATRFVGRNYHHYPVLPSTNDRAKELARQGAPEGTTVLAEEQSGGRGRLGRHWYSPPGGIWFSVILRPALPPVRAPEAVFVAAVAGAEALRAFTGSDEIGIKWPNDLVWRDKKLGGILTELGGELDRISYLVVGIGLNANQDPAAFPAALEGTAASLQEICGWPVSRAGCLQRLLNSLEKWYLVWLADGFGPVLRAWRSYEVCLNRPLLVSTPEGELSGRAVDVDLDGALLLDTGGEIRRIISGDLIVEGDIG